VSGAAAEADAAWLRKENAHRALKRPSCACR